MCYSSSSVLVLNRTSPSLLHTFVAYTTQFYIAIQHNGNSFLHQHIPRKRLRVSSCFFKLLKVGLPLSRRFLKLSISFTNCAIFHEKLRLEVNYAKSQHRRISEALQKKWGHLMPFPSSFFFFDSQTSMCDHLP